MSNTSVSPVVRGFRQLRDFSAFLLVGTVLALVWANLAPEGYSSFINDAVLPAGNPIANLFAHGKTFSFHFIVNDMFMVLFFGIFGFAWVGSKFGLDLPKPMTMPQTIVLGCVAGIGFTVALFVTAVAVQEMEIAKQYADMLKLGALLSFAAGPIAFVISRLMNVERIEGSPAEAQH